MFEPFVTRKKNTDRSGSGLGLSVVHGIVKNHGGHVRVESDPDNGTLFTVYCPRYEEETVPPEPPSIVNVLGGDENVLLVDDVDAELDAVRTRRALDLLAGPYQVLLASAAASGWAQEGRVARHFQVRDGIISRSS